MKRMAVTLVAVVLMLSVRLFAAAPTRGQHGAGNNSGSTVTLSPTSLTDGSTMIIGVAQGTTGARTYSVADTNSNTYVSAVLQSTSAGSNNPHKCEILYAKNITTTAGATTITVTQAGGSVLSYKANYVEVLGASTTAPLDQVSSAADSSDTTSHAFANSMTSASDVFIYAVGAQNSTAVFTPTSSPAFSNSSDFDTTIGVSQYYSNATGVTANNLAWTGGTARTAASCSASFVADGGGSPAVTPRGLLMGILP